MPNHIDWTAIDWGDVYPRLLLVAARKLNRLSWRGRRFGAIPGAKTAADIVHDAIVKTMSGQRAWKPRQNSLFDHLAGVISSDVSHLVESRENCTAVVDENIIQLLDHHEDPETIILRKAQEHAFLIYLAEKKPMLRTLAELILYDANAATPDLMAKLELSWRDVESLKKALRRATEAFLHGADGRQQGSNAGHAIDPDQVSSLAAKGAADAT
jgi:hypothetical protein